MKTQKLSTKQLKAMKDELSFCYYKMQGMNPLPHWRIRAEEIEKELLFLKKARVKKRILSLDGKRARNKENI